MRHLLLFCVLLVGVLSINLQFTSGSAGSSYSVSVNGKQWLQSGDHGFRANNKWYSTADNSLSVKSTSKSSGNDRLGRYTQYVTVWTTGTIDFHTSVNDYTSHSPILVFTQTFPQGANQTASGNNNDVVSAFPSFKLEKTPSTQLHYYSTSGTFLNPTLGVWELNTSYPNGIQAGVPLNLFDAEMNSLMISPFNNFMVGIHSISPSFGKNSLVCGPQGKVTSIPVGFTHSTIITASLGVNNAFNYWGSTLLGFYGKKPATVESDFSIQYLGYWTDNGAYYYYTTEPGKNYQDTMLDVDKYITSINLPVKYYQLDSWWYFKGSTNGLVLWEPTPAVFPDGISMLGNKTGKPFVLHNRWFEGDNDYVTKMGQKFAVENSYALPLSEDTYDYIMSKAKTWGLIVYEQDWLVDQYLKMEVTQNNVYTAHNWMIYMDKAAAKNGLTMQLCMPLPIHVLQSVLMPTVTQVRASGDYQREDYIQWNIGYSSIVHHALGLFPFKDDFWSSNKTQDGCEGFKPCIEKFPELQALVSALSAGPVGPADKIGFIDVDNVMATCNKDGLLLKPDVPATTLDAVFQSTFSDNRFGFYDTLYHSYSSRSINLGGNSVEATWHYLLVANTNRKYSLTPSDLYNNNGNGNNIDNFYYFDFMNGASNSLREFNSDNHLDVPVLPHQGTDANYKYYVFAPILQVKNMGYTFLGETNKFVTASSQRISGVDVSYSENSGVTLTVEYKGSASEILDLGVVNSKKIVEQYKCTIGSSGNGKLVCSDNGSKATCLCA